ncbi:dipeptidase PepV [Evansella sp. AB-P1]|uniref:dipeptidase PepV n=1 Tax=Evansella sp. AB-P1 TaxID=3037653 RepID=UPI00241FD1F2|nr:dipeptidase PepV [Evansella sp. AB-P1]MDG5787124.1 dipeptidase PepV [Evansella sp. AB-P1]
MNFYEEVLKRKDDLLSDLVNLLKIESTKDLDGATKEMPMGENIAQALSFMIKLSNQEGFKTKNNEGFYGVAEYVNSLSEEHIAILCHIDVVPATGQWTSPPFEPEIRNGRLYARGAIDDKGPTMAAFYAMKLLKELQLPLKRNVRIIFGTDEESGMSCLKKYSEIENHPIAGFAPDATFPIIHAEKGQIHAKCMFDGEESWEIGHSEKNLTLLSFNAGERANMVPETATAILTGNNHTIVNKFNTYIENNKLKGHVTTEKEKLTLHLKGVAAHSMVPFKGINAALALAHFLCTLPLDEKGNAFLSFIDQLFYEDYYGNKLKINHTDEITGPLTVNPAIFNYEKGDGYVHLNIRYPVTAKFESIKENLNHTLNNYDFFLGEIRNKNPHHVDKERPMIKALQQAYEEETKEEPTLLSSGGNTYASLLPNCVAFGAVFPGKEMTAHQKDEYIEVEDLLKATSIYMKAIYYLANI